MGLLTDTQLAPTGQPVTFGGSDDSAGKAVAARQPQEAMAAAAGAVAATAGENPSQATPPPPPAPPAPRLPQQPQLRAFGDLLDQSSWRRKEE